MTIRSTHFPFHLRVPGEILRMKDTGPRPIILGKVWGSSQLVEVFAPFRTFEEPPNSSKRRMQTRRRSRKSL